MTREQEARRLTQKAKESYQRIGREWTALAGIYKRVIDWHLWDVDFDSFDSWLAAVGDKASSQAYSMARTYGDLRETVPEKTLNQMTLANARDFAKVPVARRTADLAQAATEMPNNQYREALNKAIPGIALESVSYKGFQLDVSQRKLLMEAVELARSKYDLETESAAIELIAQQFLSEEGEEKHFRAAEIVSAIVEDAINPQALSAPPEPRAWGDILEAVRNMRTIFGFEKWIRRSRPLVSQIERVQ